MDWIRMGNMEQAWHQGWSVTSSEEWCLSITGSITKVLIAYFMGTSSFNISLPLRHISTFGMKSHTVSSLSLLSSWRRAKHAGMPQWSWIFNFRTQFHWCLSEWITKGNWLMAEGRRWGQRRVSQSKVPANEASGDGMRLSVAQWEPMSTPFERLR